MVLLLVVLLVGGENHVPVWQIRVIYGEITTTESLKIILVSCIFTFPTEHILVVSAISSCIIDHITYNISDLVVTALELPRNT